MEILTEILLSSRDGSPTLFILEDLHWADPSTNEWLSLAKSSIKKASVLLLTTTRPEYIPPWIEEEGITSIPLQRLSNKELIEICQFQAGGKSLPKNILKHIATKTEGVPLFVEELTKTVLESGFIKETKDSFEMVDEDIEVSIPSTLQDSLLARLDRLNHAREIVQMGSILGRTFTPALLRDVLSIKSDALDDAIHSLIEADIFQKIDVGSDIQYQFKHALIRDTAYDCMLIKKRQQLHHRAGRILEEKYFNSSDARPEVLAHHFTEANRTEKALPMWLQAGQLASKGNANLEAISHLKNGIKLLPELKDKDVRSELALDLHLALGGAYVVSHGFPHPKVKDTFSYARDLAKDSLPSPKLALIFFNLLSYYMNTEDYESSDELTEHVLELSKDPEFGYWFDLAASQIGGGHILRGRFSRANRNFEHLLEVFDPSLPFPWEHAPSGYIEVGAKAWWMIVLFIMGEMDKAKKLCDEHLSYADHHEDSMTLYHIHTFPSLYSLLARDWSSAIEYIEIYRPVVEEFGDPVFILTADVYESIAKAYMGDTDSFNKAVALLTTCMDIGFMAFSLTMSPWIGELLMRYDQVEEGLKWTNRMIDHGNKKGTEIQSAELHRVRGLIHDALGRASEAEGDLKEAIKIAKRQDARTYELRASHSLAKIYLAQGSKDRAKTVLQPALVAINGGEWSPDWQEARQTYNSLG